ncbi:hypothetical protein [Clostridium pasteurianum]|uniref:Uncharacterized protein n=1 Tax=Clostridium pasteurianum BC1 TaxID=86416 RepID=R4KBY7_CLOPA|nr:hypothetical protein [Clostridium pasteurianum]AGK98024.1 hypothetical protein Clopa_3214 [Clostridium pasteurianum BC1]
MANLNVDKNLISTNDTARVAIPAIPPIQAQTQAQIEAEIQRITQQIEQQITQILTKIELQSRL